MTALDRVAYSPREVAEMTGLPYKHVLLLIRRGDLHAVRAGRLFRVSSASLGRWLAGGAQ